MRSSLWLRLLLSTAVLSSLVAPAAGLGIFTFPIIIDLWPPSLSYLVVQPTSVVQTSTTTSVIVTAKFVDSSTPIEATATLTPPSSLTGLQLPVIRPVTARPLVVKFSAPLAPLPAGAPAGCVQAIFTLPANARAGDWLLSLQASDSWGNKATWLNTDLKAAGRPYSLSVTTPGDAPVPSGDALPPKTVPSGVSDSWSKEPVLVQLDAVDDSDAGEPSGVKGTYYRLGSGQQRTYSEPFTIATSGRTALTFWSVDNADNTEPEQSIDVMIDSSAPILSCDAQASYTGSATITMSGTDAVSGAYVLAYSLDGAAEEYVQATGQSVQATLTVTESGEHTLTFGVWDLAENSATTTDPVVFNIAGGSSTPTDTPDGQTPAPTTGNVVAVSGFPANGMRTLAWGSKTTIGGSLARAEGDLAGLIVVLESLSAGVATPLGEVEVHEDGLFAFSWPAPGARTAYRMSFGEAYGLVPVYSKTFVLVPKAKLTLSKIPTAVRKRTPISITGKLTPVHKGKPVVIRIEQRLKTGKWKIIKNLQLAAPKGTFATRYRFASAGVYRASARLVSTDSDHAATATSTQRLTVKE
jgi:hypothetical protein